MMIFHRIEAKRGCGWRKPGGIYLVAGSYGRYCGALPIELTTCPTCHHGIKPARGWSWINLSEFVRGCNMEGGCGDCPIADAQIQEVGLLWVGEKYYPSPTSFALEAEAMGISRRISMIPRRFKLGETWVALAHRKAIELPKPFTLEGKNDKEYKSAIFRVFKPSAIEYVIREDDPREKLEKLVERGFTLVKIIKKEEEVAA